METLHGMTTYQIAKQIGVSEYSLRYTLLHHYKPVAEAKSGATTFRLWSPTLLEPGKAEALLAKIKDDEMERKQHAAEVSARRVKLMAAARAAKHAKLKAEKADKSQQASSIESAILSELRQIRSTVERLAAEWSGEATK